MQAAFLEEKDGKERYLHRWRPALPLETAGNLIAMRGRLMRDVSARTRTVSDVHFEQEHHLPCEAFRMAAL